MKEWYTPSNIVDGAKVMFGGDAPNDFNPQGALIWVGLGLGLIGFFIGRSSKTEA